jgi:hypothetical protein
MMMRDLICSAIAKRRLLAFRYGGFERVVEPHLLGETRAGHDVLRAWFLRGYSESASRPGWRSYLLSEMSYILLLEEIFDRSRPGYNPNDKSMLQVHCRLVN